MAGLLDSGFLSSPDAQLGLGLLAMSGGNLGSAVGGLLQQQAAMEDRKTKKEMQALQQQYTRSQIAENESQNQARAAQLQMAQRKQSNQQNLLYGSQGPGMAAGAPDAGMSSPQAQMGIMALAQQYGIPPQAIQADIAFNEGKGVAAMLEKRGTPSMKVNNGYAYDENRLSPGYMPFASTSNDGRTTVGARGPDGNLIISAPQGALETFRGYQGVQADYKPIKVFNPATGREEYRSEGQVLGGAPTPPAPLRTQTQPGVTGAGYAGGDRDKANAESILIMQSELNRTTDPAARAGIGREIMRLQQQSGMPQGTPMQPQSGAYAAGPSMMEQAQAKAAETRAVNTAAADVVRDTGQRADTKRAGQLTSGVDRAIDLLKQGPTSSLLGVGIDKALGAAGMSTKGADTAAQLETLSGWLTANVPRMEGPQSNADVENYRTQAAAVGNPTKPISQRLAAAEEVQRLQKKYADLNASPAQSAAPQQAVPRVPMKGQVLQGYRFKGGNPADQANWEKM